jgi:hypothetical protein
MLNHNDATFGQIAVGIDPDIENDDVISQCKIAYASELDRMNDLKLHSSSMQQVKVCNEAIKAIKEAHRLSILAITYT